MRFLIMGMVIFTFFISACSGNVTNEEGDHLQDNNLEKQEDENNDGEVAKGYDNEEVTLTMMLPVDEDTFNIRFKEQVEERYPQMTLELIGESITSEGLQERIANQQLPDLIWAPGSFEVLYDLDLLEPLEGYVERAGFDLEVFQEGLVDLAKSLDPTGDQSLLGMPLENMPKAMFYNKDIFDSFGIDYPENGMTWEETIALARELTLERDGTAYKGLNMGFHSFAFSQLSIQGTDPKTGEVLFTEDPGTKRFFELLDSYKQIPGMMDTDNEYSFSGEMNVAMAIGQIQWLPLFSDIEGFNFDFVTLPSWSDLPDVGPATPPMFLSINKHSEHKDAAWAVIEFLSSEEGQLQLSRVGHPPTIDNVEVTEQFGGEIIGDSDESYELTPIFRMKKAELHTYSKYGPNHRFNSEDFVHKEADEFLNSEVDYTTFIREMGERYEAIVEEIKMQGN